MIDLGLTFRNMKSSSRLPSLMKSKLERLEKLGLGPMLGHAVFTRDKRMCLVEITISSKGHHYLASARCEDFIQAVECVAEKLTRQVRDSKAVATHRRRQALPLAAHLARQRATPSFGLAPLFTDA